MKTVRVLASAMSHMPLWFVMRDSGVAKQNGLALDIDVAEWALNGREAIPMEARGDKLLDGTYDFLSGLHLEPYASRATGDKRYVYLAQAQNNWDDRFIVSSSVGSLKDVEGGKVIVANAAPCVIGNLKYALEVAGVDLSKVDFVVKSDRPSKEFTWAIDAVEKGEAVAAQLDLPFDAIARRRGLGTLDLPAVPVIHNTTLCANRDWVKANGDLAHAFLRTLIAGVHFFKAHPEQTCTILGKTIAPLLGLTEDSDVRYLQQTWSEILNVKPYPHPLAIWNVYKLDAGRDSEMSRIDPLEPWDFSILRDIDDSGFIEELYGSDKLRNPEVLPII